MCVSLGKLCASDHLDDLFYEICKDKETVELNSDFYSSDQPLLYSCKDFGGVTGFHPGECSCIILTWSNLVTKPLGSPALF